MMFVFFGFVACNGGGSDAEKSECSDTTKVEKKECCAGEKPDCPSKSDTTSDHDHTDGEAHDHDHADGDATDTPEDNQ